jgi:hypothetical protein
MSQHFIDNQRKENRNIQTEITKMYSGKGATPTAKLKLQRTLNAQKQSWIDGNRLKQSKTTKMH